MNAGCENIDGSGMHTGLVASVPCTPSWECSVIRRPRSSHCDDGEKTACGACGRVSRSFYDRKERRVRDLSSGDMGIYLALEVRRLQCQSCRMVKQETLPSPEGAHLSASRALKRPKSPTHLGEEPLFSRLLPARQGAAGFGNATRREDPHGELPDESPLGPLGRAGILLNKHPARSPTSCHRGLATGAANAWWQRSPAGSARAGRAPLMKSRCSA